MCPKKAPDPYSELTKWTPFEADATWYNCWWSGAASKQSKVLFTRTYICAKVLGKRSVMRKKRKTWTSMAVDILRGSPQEDMLRVLHSGLYNVIVEMRSRDHDGSIYASDQRRP